MTEKHTPTLTYVEHNWSDTSLYLDGEHLGTLSIRDKATEENQSELESQMGAFVRAACLSYNHFHAMRDMLERCKERERCWVLEHARRFPDKPVPKHLYNDIDALLEQVRDKT